MIAQGLIIGEDPDRQLAPYGPNRQGNTLLMLDDCLLDRIASQAQQDPRRLPLPEAQRVLAKALQTSPEAICHDERGYYVKGGPCPIWESYDLGEDPPVLPLHRGARLAPQQHRARAMLLRRRPLRKPVLRATQAHKRELDYETLEDLNRSRAHQAYDFVEEATRGLEPPKQCLAELMAQLQAPKDPDPLALRDLQKEYAEHPWVHAMQRSEVAQRVMDLFADDYLPELHWSDPVDEFRIHTGGRQAYVAAKSLAWTYPFDFVLHDGEWLWPLGSPAALARDFRTMIHNLPDNTPLTTAVLHRTPLFF
jgi:hypothetical protein